MSPPVLAIGKFDALHRGHRALAERACAVGGGATLLGFTGMAEILGWPARLPLTAPSDRLRVLDAWARELGAPVTQAALPFAEVQPLSAADFLRLVAERFGARTLVVGEDFRGGRGREAGAAELVSLGAAQGLRVEVVAPLMDGDEAVSSSRVRHALAAGDVALAARLLGRPHRVVGTVERGDGRGRRIGVPTANCGSRENVEPTAGVYAGRAEIDGASWPAAINVGRAPTVAPDRPLTVEAHLIGYAGDCYGRRIGLDLVRRLRDEQRFPSLEALTAQLARDVAAAAAG